MFFAENRIYIAKFVNYTWDSYGTKTFPKEIGMMQHMEVRQFTISRNDGFMEGWPDMIRLKSGRILVVYNECTAHTNRDHSHITTRKSDDDGHTWSEKQYIGEETHHGDQWNSIRVNQLQDGRILLVCDRIADHERTQETKFYTFESTDNGDSWSEKYDIGVYGYCSDKIRELSDGSLLLCVSRYNIHTEKSEILAHKSYDGGKSWTAAQIAASSKIYTFIEPAAIELSNGTIAVFIRENSQQGYNGFIVFSDDMGKSFRDLQEIPVKGMHRPAIGFLADGRILLSYREHLLPGKPYPDLKACVFTEGEVLAPSTTQPEIHLIDHDRSDHVDQGYSAWLQLPDGTVLMANYIADDAPKPYIRGYRIKIMG